MSVLNLMVGTNLVMKPLKEGNVTEIEYEFYEIDAYFNVLKR